MQSQAAIERIGNEIKAARKRFDLSIEQLSEESKVAINHIRNIEEANRDALPEEAYLMGFVSKILKTLKVKNINTVLDYLRQDSVDQVIEEIINDSDINQKAKRWSFKLTKYHVYISLVILLAAMTWFVFNLSMKSNPRVKTKSTIILKTKPLQEELSLVEDSQEPDFLAGIGEKRVDLEVLDNAWYQIIGINQDEVLYEGDVYYDKGDKLFRFFDDTGFVLATGNAGAFKVSADGNNFILGATGARIQWFYPSSIKELYLDKFSQEPVREVQPKRTKLFGRFRRKK